MADIWVISDTHLNHENILKFTDKDGKIIRDFHDIHHMNEYIIDRWNKLIRPQDKVYHLGDVYFGPKDKAEEILKRLNGKKRLILGNHDVIYGNNILQRYFQKIYLWRKWGNEGLLMSHVPVHLSVLGESRFSGKKFINIHGHIHQNDSPEGPYVNVCVEKTDYCPVHIEELMKIQKKFQEK